MWGKLQTHGDKKNDAEVLAIAAAGAPLDVMAKLKAVRPSKETASCRLPMQASDKYIPLRWAIPAGCSPLPQQRTSGGSF